MSALLDDLFRHRVLWVTGKGGTGKSTITAALGLLASERGLRTLVIDVEANGDVARFLEAGPPRYKADKIRPNLFHLALQADEVLDEYLGVALRVPRVRRLGPVRRIFEFIATAAPGVKEVLIAGKVGFEERAHANGRPRWDLILVDAAPSGQVLSHLRGPRTIQEIVQVGLIRNQTAWVREIIEDPAKTGIVIVSLPEEMPVSEAAELIEHIPKEVNTPVLALIANRIVAAPDDCEAIAALSAAGGVLSPHNALAVDAAGLLCDIAETQAPYLARLKDLGLPVCEISLVGVERHDLTTTRVIAEALERAAS